MPFTAMYLLIFCSVILTSAPFASSLDACTNILNTGCRCNSNSSASSQQPVITCTFNTTSPVPLFSNHPESIKLDMVDLSGNNLQDLPEDFFSSSVSVGRLVLSKNNLTAIPKAVMSLAGLGSLDVSDNQLSSLSVQDLADVTGLEALDVSGNLLTEPFAVGTANGKKLNLLALNLSRNGISSIDGRQLAALCKLITLDLSHNGLTDITSQMFSPLKLSLVNLNLSSNSVYRIKSQALAQLGHLRSLSLAYNKPLINLDELFFPKHLRSLDLSHCALRIINHCRLSSLADLSFIGLSGNELQCTCQLYLLLQWYRSQHHAAGTSDTSLMTSDWTCTNASSALGNHDNASNNDTHVRNVTDLQGCKDVENHCTAMEHSDHHTKGSSEIEVTLSVAANSDTFMASWTLKENGEVAVEGFRLRYMPEDGEQMISSLIPADKRSFVMEPSELEIHFMVCLDVIAYQSAVVQQKCLSYKDESGNIVVGILAGIVFLLPCMVAMTYVFYKDHKIVQEAHYEELAKEDLEKHVDESPQTTAKCIYHLDPSKLVSDVTISNDQPPLQQDADTPVPSSSSTAGDAVEDDSHNKVSHVVVKLEDANLTASPQHSDDSTIMQKQKVNGHTVIGGMAPSSNSYPDSPPKQGLDNAGYISSEDSKSYESTYF